jgi:glycosyltransferase involved in cell wall biosynthesis
MGCRWNEDPSNICGIVQGRSFVKPLVSILIPAFNAEQWITEALQSAISQTWPRKEVIVVDDGSSDRTVATALAFEPAGVRVVSQTRQGASVARNKAFSLSQGDYIQWLDADDILAPDKISKQIQIAAHCCSRRTLISSAWGEFIFRQQRAEFVPTALWRDLTPTEWLLIKLGQHVYMQTATWLVSRELTEVAGPWDTNLSYDDDGEYFARVLLHSDGVRFVPEARVYQRVRGFASLSHLGRSDKKIESMFRAMELHVAYLRSLEDSPRVRSACVRYLQTYLVDFYPEKHHIIDRAKQLATELGGQLETPRLPWKYSWIQRVFGWGIAKSVQSLLRRIKWLAVMFWDKALYSVETRGRSASSTI